MTRIYKHQWPAVSDMSNEISIIFFFPLYELEFSLSKSLVFITSYPLCCAASPSTLHPSTLAPHSKFFLRDLSTDTTNTNMRQTPSCQRQIWKKRGNYSSMPVHRIMQNGLNLEIDISNNFRTKINVLDPY